MVFLVCVYSSKTFNVSLFIPTFIFDSIGLGFIARSITSLVTHNFKYQDDLPEFFRSKHQKAKNNNSSNAYKKSDNDSDNYNDDNDEINYWPFRVLTIILIAAIVVNIVAPTSVLTIKVLQWVLH